LGIARKTCEVQSRFWFTLIEIKTRARSTRKHEVSSTKVLKFEAMKPLDIGLVHALFSAFFFALFPFGQSFHYIRSEDLSIGRYYLGATTLGNKSYFGGGWDGASLPEIKIVDIFDHISGQWTTQEKISQYRSELVAATVASKVFFIGGKPVSQQTLSDVIDYFDEENDFWGTIKLQPELVTIDDPYMEHPVTTIVAGKFPN
jgi:hypothetical protein